MYQLLSVPISGRCASLRLPRPVYPSLTLHPLPAPPVHQVCLIHDPRPAHPTGAAYTVDCLGNMVGGRRTIYNNQPVELLARLAAESLKEGHPVWFGCEVGKAFAGKLGISDPLV